jgi:hypothetical protein
MPYLLVLLLLSGCNPFGAFKPTSDEILTSNWAPNPENKNKKPIKPLYGYRTLGDTMYYSAPLENSDNRMVGKNPDQAEKNQPSPYFEEWIPYPMR